MQNKFLSGKFAVVTGGTRGIGRAIVERLLQEGAAVALCGRNPENVARAARELKGQAQGEVLAETADVSRLEEVERLFRVVESRFGALDILVNNAGLGVFRGIGEMTPDEWHAMIDLNLNGVFYCSRAAIPLMKRRGAGYVINISSLAGKNPFSGGAGYNASKFGLNGFSEAMMMDLRYQNIRVSYIMPGSVDTEFGGRGARTDWKIAPEDIAEIAVALLRMPARTLVSRVEVRPSQPKK
ncbi:MAG: SDR family oxidoreductase [Bryobacterales bacterium]|nr:SDR family oxidoreductase [Bryobacterales bacterium]